MKYIKQFDGLRAFAVIAVIIHHWVPEDVVGENWYHLGAYGVDLFFVLSGFLITKILIKQKSKKEPFFKSYKTFIIRRALRIFPIYYLFLLVIFLVFSSEDIMFKVSAVTYQFNWYAVFNDWGATYYVRHLWSLSAEEQFYIFWPVLILLINPKKGLKYIPLLCLCFLVLTAGFYLFAPKIFENLGPIKLFPFHSFTILALGGLLAYLKTFNIAIPFRKIVFFSLIVLFWMIHSDFFIPNFYGKSLIRTVFPTVPLLFVVLIDKAYTGFNGVIKNILENKQLVFIGQISYGLYLYHMIIPYFVSKLEVESAIVDTSLRILVLSIVTLISYYLIENPINKLKRNFKY